MRRAQYKAFEFQSLLLHVQVVYLQLGIQLLAQHDLVILLNVLARAVELLQLFFAVFQRVHIGDDVVLLHQRVLIRHVLHARDLRFRRGQLVANDDRLRAAHVRGRAVQHVDDLAGAENGIAEQKQHECRHQHQKNIKPSGYALSGHFNPPAACDSPPWA